MQVMQVEAFLFNHRLPKLSHALVTMLPRYGNHITTLL